MATDVESTRTTRDTRDKGSAQPEVPHLTVAERAARGKAARWRCRAPATPYSTLRRTGPIR